MFNIGQRDILGNKVSILCKIGTADSEDIWIKLDIYLSTHFPNKLPNPTLLSKVAKQVILTGKILFFYLGTWD